MFYNDPLFEWGSLLTDDEIDELEEQLKKLDKEDKRKDYCWDCMSDDVEWHCMVLKCKSCGKFLIGGV